MIDLGASIDILRHSLYALLNIDLLRNSGLMVQLANRSKICSKDIMENALVEVEDLFFPTDFYILDTADDKNASEILLGRMFLKTSKTKVDVFGGILTREYNDIDVKYDIHDTNLVCSVNMIDFFVNDCIELGNEDSVEVITDTPNGIPQGSIA